MKAVIKRSTKPDLLRAIRDLEAKGYECTHPIRQKELQGGYLQYRDGSNHQHREPTTTSGTYYVTMWRDEE